SLVALFNGLLLLRLSRRLIWRMLSIVLVVASSLTLVLSFSRGSIFAAVLAGAGVWMIGARRIRGVGLALACAGAVAVVLVWGASRDLMDLSAGERLSSLNSESRDELMERLVTTGIREHPVVGVGFFQKEGAADVARGDPHNSFLLVLLEHGTIGLAAL